MCVHACVNTHTCEHVSGTHVCVCIYLHVKGATSLLTLREHVKGCYQPDFTVSAADSLVCMCAVPAGNTTQEIQVSRVHGH